MALTAVCGRYFCVLLGLVASVSVNPGCTGPCTNSSVAILSGASKVENSGFRSVPFGEARYSMSTCEASEMRGCAVVQFEALRIRAMSEIHRATELLSEALLLLGWLASES